MKLAKSMMIAGVTALLSTTVLAATVASVKDLSSGDDVTVSGTVEDFDPRHPFTLRDSTGSIKVDMSSAKPIMLKNGEKVIVSGTVDKSIFETNIAASSIDISTGDKAGNSVPSAAGQNAAGSAPTVTIQSLPESGLVKINGVVDSVDGAKNFTLRDSTGHIIVTIKSGELSSLNKGTEVTVTGYVDKGLTEKSISATEIRVHSGISPVTQR